MYLSIRNHTYIRVLTFIVILLFLCQNLSYAGERLDGEYLAARSRIQLFFSKDDVNLTDSQGIALSIAMGELQKTILEEGRLDIAEDIDRLNRNLSTIGIKITSNDLMVDLKSGIPFIRITINGSKNIFKAYFIKETQRKVNEKLGIQEKDLRHFDCPGLEGVWFVKAAEMDLWDSREIGGIIKYHEEDSALAKKALQGFTELEPHKTKEQILWIWSYYKIPVEITFQNAYSTVREGYRGMKEYRGIIHKLWSDAPVAEDGRCICGIGDILLARPLNMQDAIAEYFRLDTNRIAADSSLIQKIKLLRLLRDSRIPVEVTISSDGRTISGSGPIYRVVEGRQTPVVMLSDDFGYYIEAIQSIRPITDDPLPETFVYDVSRFSLVEAPPVNPISVYALHPETSIEDRLATLRNWRDNQVRVNLVFRIESTGRLREFSPVKILAVVVQRPRYPDDGSNIFIFYNYNSEILHSSLKHIYSASVVKETDDGRIIKGTKSKAKFVEKRKAGEYKLLADNPQGSELLSIVQDIASRKDISLKNVRVYGIQSIVETKDDFVHGYFDRGANELFLSMNIMQQAKAYDKAHGTKTLEEYIEHEFRCRGEENHQYLRNQQRQDYARYGNYKTDDLNDEGRLRDIIREDTDMRNAAKEYIETVKSSRNKTQGRKVVLALDTDIGNIASNPELIKQIDEVADIFGEIAFVADSGKTLLGERIDTQVKELRERGLAPENIKVIVVTNKKDKFKKHMVTLVEDTAVVNYVPVLEILRFALTLHLEPASINRLKDLYYAITGQNLIEADIERIRSGELALLLPPVEKISLEIYRGAIEVLTAA